jgi:hypothetical protein
MGIITYILIHEYRYTSVLDRGPVINAHQKPKNEKSLQGAKLLRFADERDIFESFYVTLDIRPLTFDLRPSTTHTIRYDTVRYSTTTRKQCPIISQALR